jgi:hypothetical protein
MKAAAASGCLDLEEMEKLVAEEAVATGCPPSAWGRRKEPKSLLWPFFRGSEPE